MTNNFVDYTRRQRDRQRDGRTCFPHKAFYFVSNTYQSSKTPCIIFFTHPAIQSPYMHVNLQACQISVVRMLQHNQAYRLRHCSARKVCLPSSPFRSICENSLSQQTTSSKPLKLQWVGLILSCRSFWIAGEHWLSGLHNPLLPPPSRQTSPSARNNCLCVLLLLQQHEYRLRAFESRVLRKTFGSSCEQRQEAAGNSTVRIFRTFTDHQMLFE